MSRRITRWGTAGLAVALLATAGCSKAPDNAAAPSTLEPAATTSAAVTTSASAMSAVPADLQPILEKLYSGGDVPASAPVAAALAGRTPVPVTDPQVVKAGKGEWKGTGVAVVQVKDDVTLLTQEASGWQVVGGWWPSLGVAGPQLGGKRFVGMYGSDMRPGEDLTHRNADALQILGYDGKDGGGVLGVARDSYIPGPGGGKTKVNGIMRTDGPEAITTALQNHIGVPLEGYVIIGFPQFTAMIDELGGVDVTLPAPVDMGSQGTLPAGQQHLNGEQALALARERVHQPQGDFNRSGHQSLLILGGAVVARNKGVAGLPGTMSIVGKHLTTNLSPAQLLTLFATVYAMDAGKVGHKVSGGTITTVNGESVVLPGAAEKAIYADFQDGNLAP